MKTDHYDVWLDRVKLDEDVKLQGKMTSKTKRNILVHKFDYDPRIEVYYYDEDLRCVEFTTYAGNRQVMP